MAPNNREVVIRTLQFLPWPEEVEGGGRGSGEERRTLHLSTHPHSSHPHHLHSDLREWMNYTSPRHPLSGHTYWPHPPDDFPDV